jgi:hypothetical protein
VHDVLVTVTWQFCNTNDLFDAENYIASQCCRSLEQVILSLFEQGSDKLFSGTNSPLKSTPLDSSAFEQMLHQMIGFVVMIMLTPGTVSRVEAMTHRGWDPSRLPISIFCMLMTSINHYFAIRRLEMLFLRARS